jgi:hypothetical protein
MAAHNPTQVQSQIMASLLKDPDPCADLPEHIIADLRLMTIAHLTLQA